MRYESGYEKYLKDIDLSELKRIKELNIPKPTEEHYTKLRNMNIKINLYKNPKPIIELYLFKEIDEFCIMLIYGVSYDFLAVDTYHRDWIKSFY